MHALTGNDVATLTLNDGQQASVQPGSLVRPACSRWSRSIALSGSKLMPAAPWTPEQVVLAVLSQPEDDLDSHPLTVEAGHAFIQAIVENGNPLVCLG
jgi:hypothetical protein